MRQTEVIAALALLACTPAGGPYAGARSPLAAIEREYQVARYWDDQLRLTESLGADTTPGGLPVALLRDSLRLSGERLRDRLTAARDMVLPPDDRKALSAMLASPLAAPPVHAADSMPAAPACPPDAASSTLDILTSRVMACYGSAESVIVVDGDTLNRLAILGLLGRTEDRGRRKRMFLALEPVWRSVNGDDSPGSPYRTMLRLRRAAWSDSGSPIDAKGPAFGLAADELERWLVTALERWRAMMPDTLFEPWDWYYQTGAASRQLSPRIPSLDDLGRVNELYYRRLGADPVRLGVHYDLAPRPGKYPVAFTDFGTRPRWSGARLLPGEPWVFASYLSGGFDNLAELLHESGHAIHIAAIRTRPAYMDWPDNDTFTEALADLPAMELYEPTWELRFLGDSVALRTALTAKYAGIVFDMAWALFEIRVHRTRDADPNAVWTAIARDYLRIRPHPEWSWWAMRGQLIESPGYLVNYALGAFLVADMRAAIRTARGSQPWTDPRQYAWLSERIYRFGLERSSRQVLEDLLGRPLRPDGLLADLARASR